MRLWQRMMELTITRKLRLENGAKIALKSAAGAETLIDLNELAALDSIGAADLAKIDGITNGTIAAGKAIVVDANKDAGDARNFDVVNLDAGASGTAGTVDVFPATALKGKLAITAADSAGDTTTTIVNASQAAARSYTIPDAGASASFVMTEGAQTVNGVKTFGSVPVLPAGGVTLGATTITEAEAGVLDSAVAGTPAASKAVVLSAGVGIGAHRQTARNLRVQAAPAAKTVSATLTAAEIVAGLLTVNQGAAGASVLTLPLGTDLETNLIATHPGLANDDSFEFTLVNISTVAAEDASIATNTGWTLVGNMDVASNAAATDKSHGTFRARRTAANTYSLYRVG